jgi:hypothetical protein
MLYRRTPPNPPRLLLRIVATAGAGALLGVAACSSSSDSAGPPGVAGFPPADAADDGESDANQIMTGIVANPDATIGCGGSLGVCGSVGYIPQDGGEDANPDATGPCGESPCPMIDGGILVMPYDGGEGIVDAAILDATEDVAHCGGFCGVIVHPDQ